MPTDSFDLFGLPVSGQTARLLPVEAVLLLVAGLWAVLFSLRACREWRPFLGYATGLTLAVVLLVGVMGLRGDHGNRPPWHVFLDMKYQPKYTAQGQSPYFADGRSMRGERTRPQFTDGRVAFAGEDYFPDAGLLLDPDPKFARLDPELYQGRKVPLAEVDEVVEGTPTGRKIPAWLDRVPLAKLAPYASRYLSRADFDAWQAAAGKDDAAAERLVLKALLDRGQARFNVTCAVCHGATGGKPGEAVADGITTQYGMVGVANYHTPRLRRTPDGDIFNTITNGKGTMMPYAHVVGVEDRWAIVTYVRALQAAQIGREADVPAGERGKP